jgi:hypothetical protein
LERAEEELEKYREQILEMNELNVAINNDFDSA